MSVKSPNPIDLYVGSRIKLQRTVRGISQQTLAASINVTFQQVQKYERGVNRVGPSRLLTIAKVLGVPISYFFQDSWDEKPKMEEADSNATPDLISEFLSSAEGLKLNQSFSRIKDAPTRDRVLALVKTLAGMDKSENPDAVNEQS